MSARCAVRRARHALDGLLHRLHVSAPPLELRSVARGRPLWPKAGNAWVVRFAVIPPASRRPERPGSDRRRRSSLPASRPPLRMRRVRADAEAVPVALDAPLRASQIHRLEEAVHLTGPGGVQREFAEAGQGQAGHRAGDGERHRHFDQGVGARSGAVHGLVPSGVIPAGPARWGRERVSAALLHVFPRIRGHPGTAPYNAQP